MHTFLLILCAVVVVAGCAYLYAAIPGRRWKTQEYRPEPPIRAEVVSSESGEQAALSARAEVLGRRRRLHRTYELSAYGKALQPVEPDPDPAAVTASLRDARPVWSDDEIRRARVLAETADVRAARQAEAGWRPGTGGTGLPGDAASVVAVEPDLDGLDPLADPLILFPPVSAALFDTGVYRLVNEGHSGDTGAWRWEDLRAAADAESSCRPVAVTPAMVSARIRRRPSMVPAGVAWDIPRESVDPADVDRHAVRFFEVTG